MVKFEIIGENLRNSLKIEVTASQLNIKEGQKVKESQN